MNNKYGYKICFKDTNKIRYITNTYDLAVFVTTMKENKNIDFNIFSIKRKEYKKLWRGCPF